MITDSTKSLQDFIADNGLKRPDGTTAFEAVINFYKNETLQNITSEVQVVTIPGMMALYVLEFFKEVYGFSDMYSTENFEFRHNKGMPLEIFMTGSSGNFIISILPLK